MKYPLTIHLIADYGTGDPAFTEVMQKLTLLKPDIRVFPVSVTPFSTIATGFWTYQLAMVNPLPGAVIYTNTAPRRDLKESREKNEGERLVYAVLENGSRIVGVNAGYCFSFVKPHISKFHFVSVANKGSQFRSRDFYPEAVIGLAEGHEKLIGERLDTAGIPEAPANRIGWIDGYGNIKTTFRLSSANFKSGQPLIIDLNGIKRTAYYTDGTFSVREGQLAFAPGSSGGEDRFMEIFLRGLSAWKEFDQPRVGQEFAVLPVS
jgi:S-adenosylmethionine hydrolase